MAGFRSIADKYHLFLIEDAAHAIEAWSGGKKVGTTADVSCFSFYATKNICTGEGGMVTTNLPEVAARVRRLAQHGLDHDAWKRFSSAGYKHYLAVEPGWKFNMMDLQAALGIHQLARIEKISSTRESQWRSYLADLSHLTKFRLPPEASHGRHARHLFTLQVNEDNALSRDGWVEALHNHGVGSGVHYLSITEHPAYELYKGTMPNAERIGRGTLSIPLGGSLTEKQRAVVVSALEEISGSN
jgi:dTDP-4-amino-4,6-dideoxygalactose transaminase